MSETYVPDTWAENWVALTSQKSFFKAEWMAQLYRCLNTKRNTMDTAEPGFYSKYSTGLSTLFKVEPGYPNSIYYPDGTRQNQLQSYKQVVDITNQLYWVFQKTMTELLVSVEQEDKIWIWVTGTEEDNTPSVFTEELLEIQKLGFVYFQKPVHWKRIVEALREFYDTLDARARTANYGILLGTAFVTTWGYPDKSIPGNGINITRTGGKDYCSLMSLPYSSFTQADPVFGTVYGDPCIPYALLNVTRFIDYTSVPAQLLHELGWGWPYVISEEDYLATGPYNKSWLWRDLPKRRADNNTYLIYGNPSLATGFGDMNYIFYNGTLTHQTIQFPNRYYPSTGAVQKGSATVSMGRSVKKGDTITVAQIGPATFLDYACRTVDTKSSQYTTNWTGSALGDVTGYIIVGSDKPFPGTITVTIGTYNPLTDTTPIDIACSFSESGSLSFKVYKLREPYQYVWRKWEYFNYTPGIPIRKIATDIYPYYRYETGILFHEPTVTTLTFPECDDGVWEYRNIYGSITADEWAVKLL